MVGVGRNESSGQMFNTSQVVKCLKCQTQHTTSSQMSSSRPVGAATTLCRAPSLTNSEPQNLHPMAKGALTLTSELLPGCFHDEVYYMSVGGSPIVGEKQNRQWWKFWEPTTVEGFAYNSYMGVCGEGGVQGENGRRAFHFVTKQFAHLNASHRS